MKEWEEHRCHQQQQSAVVLLEARTLQRMLLFSSPFMKEWEEFFNEMKEINSIFRVFYKKRSIWTARTGRPSILNTSSLIHPIQQHVGVPNDGTGQNTAVRKSGRFPLFRPNLRYSVGTVCRAWASRNASNHSLKCEVCRFQTGR